MATPQLKRDVHERACVLHAQGELDEAAQLLAAAIAEGESCELWSDWGAVQASRDKPDDAERAFRRALRMDRSYRPAAENLGVLLYAQGRFAEARPYLEQALGQDADVGGGVQSAPAENADQRPVLVRMLARCTASGADAEGAQAGSVVPATSSLQCLPVPRKEENARPLETKNSGADPKAVAAATALMKADESYDEWCTSAFGQRIPVPGARISTSWAEDSPWGLRAYIALATLECEYAKELLREIATKKIPGDIAEFGIFEGWWVNFLWQTTESLGLRRRIYGFDSFEGLSEPHPDHDHTFWKKGQYACSLEQVSKNVKCAERPRVKLVKGFFETSLHGAEALLAEQFCYVRIDCDIYQPALQCLQYLGPRLADGAIVVFDDWPHMRGLGEQRALEEWLPNEPQLQFEFLFYGPIGHFYTRVHHRK
jgi:tetratricopeptide (TPR) repeat protein